MSSPNMVPKQALDYIKRKNLTPAFSYKDVWNEEHATAFTVAKAMQTDVLADIKGAVEQAIKNGETFDSFKKNLAPTLQGKGWWGKKTMTDPVTGREVHAQLGSDRRLRTIYSTNLRSAYQKGTYDRAMDSPAHPYLMYRLGPSHTHREQHEAWEGLILPKDDPWWNSHLPPNGYGCKCYITAVSKARKERYEREGITIPPRADGTGGGTLPVKTTAPKTVSKQYYNERKGIIEHIPKGITPGFNWNQGLTGRVAPVFEEALKKGSQKFPAQFEEIARSLVHNTVFQEAHNSFVSRAAAGSIKGDYLSPVGFIDRTIAKWMKQHKNINVGETSIINMRAGLINGPKGARHAKAADALSNLEWSRIIDYLLDASVYFDPDGKSLLYVYEQDAEHFVKIAVQAQYRKSSHGTVLTAASLRSAYKIGIDEYSRISALQKIK
ncbi:phage head morphogenesis protein [Sediminispirochaeta bajacaliforniensis]|uniref:phage head morphogenesis protein n=1 Tax=Sediminispirochaeta bajacaliforniensis TaxID=148 RepID=UPI00036628B3|nr:phage minor head protein [Sediminispirochaeta bajacaliforniensis]